MSLSVPMELIETKTFGSRVIHERSGTACGAEGVAPTRARRAVAWS